MRNKTNIFIDTDMGNDDIMALCLLLSMPSVNITGISTVFGVSTNGKGYCNLTSILNYLGIFIPLCNGYEKGITNKKASFPPRDVARANDLTLLQNIPINKKKSSLDNKPVEDFIFTLTLPYSKIIALGPLTNIAKTIQKYGDVFTKNISELVIMGGGLKRGNVAPSFTAEYNMYLDPQAASLVFSSGIPITMVGIDATDYVPVEQFFVDKVKNIQPKDKRSQILQAIIINNDKDFRSYYDPLAAYILYNKSIIADSIQTEIQIIDSGENIGQTKAIFSPFPTTTVVTKVNNTPFYDALLQVLKGGEL